MGDESLLREGKNLARELFNEFIVRSRVARYYIRTVDRAGEHGAEQPVTLVTLASSFILFFLLLSLFFSIRDDL